MSRTSLKKWLAAIRNSWDSKTCYPGVRANWDERNPAVGQCAVTALLVQEELGGQILYNSDYDHYWNRLPDGRQLDLTKEQFSFKKKLFGSPVKRDIILTSPNARKFKTPIRYDLFKRRVRQHVIAS